MATLAALLVVATAGSCTVTVDLGLPRRPVSGRVAGVLNGLNNSQPPTPSIAPLGLTMWRGPQASWLWPNRTGCRGPRTCCTLDSCPAPFAEAARLSALGLRQQYILDGLLLGVGDCEWRSFHDNPHNCSLPGGPSDPDMAEWEYTVRAGAAEALRAGISELYFDVWVRCTIAPTPAQPTLPSHAPCLTHRTSPTARTRCSAWRTTPAPTTPT